MRLSLRAKFLLLSALVQALLFGLLIANSVRIMDRSVERNAYRAAQQYAMTLGLALGPAASRGRLGGARAYLDGVLANPADNLVRYVVVLDSQNRPEIGVGEVPPDLAALYRPGAARRGPGLQTVRRDAMLHARAPIRLRGDESGWLDFGISTRELQQNRDDVLDQGGMIALAGFSLGLLLMYAFTLGLGRRLNGLTAQSQRLARGDYSLLLPEQGGDEIEIVSRSLNSLSLALRERIAQLELAELRRSESEARFQELFDMAPVPLSVTDRSGRLLDANRALLSIFGRELDSVVGQPAGAMRFWSVAGEFERVSAIFRRDGALQGEEASVQLPDGSTGSVAIWSSALSLNGEKSVIWALLDQTEEVNAKRALKELNTSLERRVRERSAALETANRELSLALDTLKRTQHELLAAEKMAALGALVAGIAHELNTPIGNSLLAATTLADRVDEFERLAKAGQLRRSVLTGHLDEVRLACQLISGALQKAANLIASFKQVAVDQTSDRRRSFDLLHVLQDTLATYLPRLRRARCAATLEVPAGLLFDSYPGSLYQVVNNLINNALVHAFDQHSAAAITISARELDGEQVELTVRDNGAGMTAEVLRQVFDPFFTTKMGQGGTGLGMHIVYNIVTGVLGGHIDIQTAPGAGTAVRLRLPKRAPSRDAARVPERAAPQPG